MGSSTRRSPEENACHWATTIKQALMPVTPQSSGPLKTSSGTLDLADPRTASCSDVSKCPTAQTNRSGADSMAQLKVPNQGGIFFESFIQLSF